MYGGTPSVIYLAIDGACIGLWTRAPWAPDAIAGLLLTLLLVGIRNAWDLVTWIAPMRGNGSL